MSRRKAEKKRANQYKQLCKYEKLVDTPDDWCPTFATDGGRMFVEGKVFLDDYPDKSLRYFVRTCFWGGDDMGRELDFATNDITEAKAMFEKWRAWLEAQKVVTLDGLKALGFENG